MTGGERGRGRVVAVSGPVVVAVDMPDAHLYDMVAVGELGLLGEVIRLDGERVVVQVYEDTSGVAPGAPVVDTGGPLQVELGPGLLGHIFDGVQRPLPRLALGPGGSYEHPFIARGRRPPALDREATWEFAPAVAVGDRVGPGDVLGTMQETPSLEHRILVPPDVEGTVTTVHAGDVHVTDPVATIDDRPVTAMTRWPVRRPRPVTARRDPLAPLVTGQRVVDVLFPVAQGGTATVPGGFGTGKTVLEQTLAKWAHADVVVYIGCGERGNEMAEVLEEFPRLVDPRSGARLMERTILVANTSNMPVAAREASIYTGVTIAEYYRDQGYHVALMADSTSRWAEALREVSGRLEEMPGEEGYPAYLPSRLAEFYERSGAVATLGSTPRNGSLTIIGAVSPPGGDLSEPVTQYSLRLAGTFWALDTDLARRRHFPAIHWTRSFSLYRLDDWFDAEVAADWSTLRRWAREVLAEEEELEQIVRILGTDVLAPRERLVFGIARVLREDFLQQSATDPVDAYCPLAKQHEMLRVVHHAHRRAAAAVDAGREVDEVLTILAEVGIVRMRFWPPEEAAARADALVARIDRELEAAP